MMLPLLAAAAMMFPALDLHALDGRTLQPRDLQATPVVYVLGFTFEGRDSVKRWIETLEARGRGKLRVVQMPILNGLTALFRPLMARGMARSLPAALQANTFIVTQGDRLVKGLSLETPERAPVVVLVDTHGAVCRLVQGEATEPNQARILEAWNALEP